MKNSLFSTALFMLLAAGASGARAQEKYPVDMGDTLALVAAFCDATPDELRELNPALAQKADGDPLPPGVLNVPNVPNWEAESYNLIALRKTFVAAPNDTLRSVVANLGRRGIKVDTVALKRENREILGEIRETQAFGKVVPLHVPLTNKGCIVVTVGPEETVDVIAENCRASGFTLVSAQGIRLANNLDGEPKAGQNLVVPLRTIERGAASEKEKTQLNDDVRGFEAYFAQPTAVYRAPFPSANSVILGRNRPFVIMASINTSSKASGQENWIGFLTTGGTMWAPQSAVRFTKRRRDVRAIIARLPEPDSSNIPPSRDAGVPDVSANIPQNQGGATPLDENILRVAQQQLGKPYIWGSRGPRGFDCSGLVAFATAQNGIRNVTPPARFQVHVGTGSPISLRNLQRGDRLYFDAGSRPGIDHTGIYLGGNKFIEANGGANRVKISTLCGPRTRNDDWFVSARRGYGGRRRIAMQPKTSISPAKSPQIPPQSPPNRAFSISSALKGLAQADFVQWLLDPISAVGGSLT
jgi:cell wall-associated NlpC family hydrolase